MRSRLGLTTTLIMGLLAWASVGPSAQAPPVQTVSPFDNIGFIDAATVDNPNDVFSGGTLTMNGTVFIVPRNTILQMPAFALTWQELFAKAPAAYQAAHQTGLARLDVPPPLTTFEVHLQGNRVVNGASDQSIVGLMFVAQQSLNNGAGFINFIDYTTGEMRVGGTLGDATTGARVRINDPIGRHGLATDGLSGAGHTALQDIRFQQDEDNPTVRSETGYPMCVPRVAPGPTADDPLCPQKNRLKGTDGTYLMIYTMDPLPFDGSDPVGPDPRVMAPFEIGDYVDYQGTLTADAAGTYVSAWGVIANIGVFTSPGTQPVYTAIDVMLLGTGGIPIAQLPQEAAVRTRIEGFTTDPTSFVDLFAQDVDACTGATSLRYYATIGVDNLVKLGRWRWRPNTDLAFLPPSRMLVAISENGFDPSNPTPNGLVPGVYTAPNFTFIFPENLPVGNPKVPSNFQDFPFLASGSGPYPAPGPGSLGIAGQLAPWPGASAPVPPLCAGPGGTAIFSPIADAGINQTVRPRATVTIDAGNSRDTTQPLPLPLTFTWVQNPGGPRVVLTPDPTAPAVRTFVAPPLGAGGAPIVLSFTVTVSNGSLSSQSTMTVTVRNNPAPTDTLTAGVADFRLRRSQLTVTVTTSNPTAVLTVEGFGVMGPALAIAPGVPAPLTDRLYRQVGVAPQPQTITIVSSLGGRTTVPVTVR